MFAAPPPQHLGARLTGAVAAALALSVVPDAAAQTRESPLAQGLLDLPRDEPPAAERYQTPDGRVRFMLDRSGVRAALVRFEGSDEVHVLRPVPGPRGDEFFKTDTGDVLLRVTALGSVIVYTDANRTGAPATLAGRSAPMAPPIAPVGGLQARMEALAREAARRGRAVTFTPPPNVQGPMQQGIIADAAARAAQGLAAAPMTVIVRRVVIRYGDRPAAAVANDNLMITVAPQLGYAGRPSAEAVRRAVQQPVQGPEH